MEERAADALTSDPRLIPFYPLLYIAWADGDLDPREVSIVRRHLERAGLDSGALDRWLDPGRPPTAADLLALLSEVRRLARGIESPERRSIAGLGMQLAAAGGQSPSDAERTALAELESVLGLEQAGVGDLLGRERPIADVAEARPAFDVARMGGWIDGACGETRARVRALLADERFRPEYGLATAEYRERVLDRLRILAEEGFGRLAMPVSVGGDGDRAAFVAAFETLALGDLSLLVKFGVQFGLFGGAILELGTTPHHERYLPSIASLELPGCFAMTETGHGSNVADLETVAAYDPATAEFEIRTPVPHARKDYIGNAAAHGRLAVVFAQLQTLGERHGVHAFLVPIRAHDGGPLEGVRIEDCGEKAGLNGVDNGRISFDRVRVPRENLLDRFASVSESGTYDSPIASQARRFLTMLGTLVGGRVAVGSAAVSVSKVALATAIRYAAGRRQFGPADAPERILLDYPGHQRRLLPRLATTYALGFAFHDLQRRYADPDEERRPLESAAAGLKAYATRHATDTIQACREACGGQGYLAENRFGTLRSDSDVFTTFEGDNTVLWLLVARDLLTGFRREFGDLRGLARLLADRVRTAVTERNPVITRRTDEDHLRDPEFQSAMLSVREEDLLFTLARRVKARTDEGMDGFDALTACQNHALAAARAHVEAAVVRSVIEAEGSAPTSSLAEAMERLRSLHALAAIERERAWFLEHGYLDPPKTKAVRTLVTGLCAEVRPQAVPLVDAFGIPEPCLGTIARAP